MKTLLLSLSLFGATTLMVTAQDQPVMSMPVQKQIKSKAASTAKVLKSAKIAGRLQEKEIQLSSGLKMKVLQDIRPAANRTINPDMHKTRRAAIQKEGYVLIEDFEEWDGDMDNTAWIPDGWTIDHKDSPESNRGWKMTKPFSSDDYISSKCMTYEMFDEEDVEVDEWLITPEVTLQSGMQLSWESMPTIYFYDWNPTNPTFQPVTKDDIINDIKVNVSTDGGVTWTTIFSMAEDWAERNKSSFFTLFNYSMLPYTVSLENYAGKNIRVGFQFVGHGPCNTNFIDNVTIGLPPTQTSYSRPMSNLYFGLDEYDRNLPGSIMAGPVFQPIKYTNSTKTRKYESVWTYTDSEGEKTSTDQNLVVTYTTDHTTPATSRNNWYEFPVLTATSATTAPEPFSYQGFFQAGGKGEFELTIKDDDGTITNESLDLGLTVADAYSEGTATWADITVPYFGYNNESDRFWSRDMLGEDYVPDDPDNWKHLEKIGNYHYSPESPIVIYGARINGYGKINRNGIKMKAEIYLLNATGTIPNEPAYVAECRPEDIIIVDRGGSNDFLSFNFRFDEPVVISKKEAYAYFVTITGFRDAENVEYFSPEMTEISTPTGLGLGWCGFKTLYQGDEPPFPYTWSAVANYTKDELVSFFIMLDAAFPWLETDVETLTLSEENVGTVMMDSYHHADDLTVEGMPEWLTVEKTGRYGETTLKFAARGVPEDKPTATVTVKGHGVNKTLSIDTSMTSIDRIIMDETANGPEAVYTLDGRRIDTSKAMQPGIYIIRTADGKTRKVIRR